MYISLSKLKFKQRCIKLRGMRTGKSQISMTNTSKCHYANFALRKKTINESENKQLFTSVEANWSNNAGFFPRDCELHLCSRSNFQCTLHEVISVPRPSNLMVCQCACSTKQRCWRIVRGRLHTWRTKHFECKQLFLSEISPFFWETWQRIRGKGNSRNRTFRRWSWESERSYNRLRMRQTPRSNRDRFSSRVSFSRNLTVNLQIKEINHWR